MKKKKKIKIMLISIIKIMKKIHMPLQHLNKIIIKKKVVIKNLQLMKKKISNFKENYTEILNYNLKIEYMNNV